MQSQMTTGAARQQPRWARLQIVGLLMVAAGPSLLLIAGALFGIDLSDATFFLIPIAVALIAAVLVWRFGTWAKIVGAVLALLIGFMFFWAIFGLFTPQSFFDFMFGLLLVPGSLLGLIAGISAVVAKGRGHVAERATGGEARALRIVLIGLAAFAVLSGVVTLVSKENASAGNAAATVTMESFKFKPKSYSVPGGSSVFVKNGDPFLHTFTIKELGIDKQMTVGSSATIQIPSKPGTYILFCKPHSDNESPDPSSDDMAATFIVT